MVDFDEKMKGHFDKIGGLYRRYSDDIVVVCPNGVDGIKQKEFVIEAIREVNLTIEPRKTNLYLFNKNDLIITCSHEFKGENKKLEYLGFSFDGNRIQLKNASISKFYYKMKRSVKRGEINAIRIHNYTRGILFERRLISRFTMAGSKSHKIYKRKKSTKRFYRGFNTRPHGNYLTYVQKASWIMHEPNILNQLRRCPNKLCKLIKTANENIKKQLLKMAWRQFLTYGKTYD